MPSILSDEDKQTVKRTVPKASNKIHAVAVARLYIAYPNRQRWTYTGLQGAAVLANDLVGNTFWIKMVDISPMNRGVIWDQEIYDTFSYNQDRLFFHTFELEDCLAGLSFADEKEAKQFKKKMDEREKNAHKNTKSKPFGNAAGTVGSAPATNGGKQHHSLLGGLFGRHSSGSHQPPAQSIIPPKEVSIASPAPSSRPSMPSSRRNSTIDTADPSWQPLLQELLQMGITEDQIEENAEFIKMYIEQKKAGEAAADDRRSRAPPPPPPGGPPAAARMSPQNTGSTSSSRRGPPPAPPPARRTRGEAPAPPAPRRSPSPEPSPPRQPSPPPGPKFRVPPPIAEAGKLVSTAPTPPARARASSNTMANPGPPPPPRPPKTPIEDEETPSRFGVPPPFAGQRAPPGPPPPPSRGPVPPPPPIRDAYVPPPPPLPPKAPGAPTPSSIPPPPPLPPSSAGPPPPPPLPTASRSVPPPPPMPPSSGAPPPPPLPPSGGAPPPPPLPPGGAAPPLPKPSGGRDGLLADIRGGARLRKVSETEKKDRSAAAVPGAASASPAPGGGGGGGADGGLAGALASALAARKSKVSHSDDEDDKDDW
ncbi:hypothetical protein H2201_005776 [Coniosporium apollinis]|uniref:WH1 domain-containing protein n=1 Tax=Coniosporium apollinis TaxID=61459 RepID=A0ABQ9NSU6_9PEZI|nr:hypothetical protein H2201_005776 [Coniosporium apollinis]